MGDRIMMDGLEQILGFFGCLLVLAGIVVGIAIACFVGAM